MKLLLFLLSLIIINFLCAISLKNAFKNTFINYKWVKYFLVIPPFAILFLVLLFVLFIIASTIKFTSSISDTISNYFKYP